jgi:hypothetical protein
MDSAKQRLELKATFTRTISKSLNTPVIDKSITVEHDC